MTREGHLLPGAGAFLLRRTNVGSSPPPDENSLSGIRFQRTPVPPSKGFTPQFAHPQKMVFQDEPLIKAPQHRRSRLTLVFLLSLVLIVSVSAIYVVPALKIGFQAPGTALIGRAVAST